MNETQAKIIQATIAWIKTGDYQALSMRKLAAKIGMTTGAIYKAFPNKEALLHQVLMQLSQQLATQLLASTTGTARERLLGLARRLCQLSQEETKLVNFLFFNPSLQSFYQDPNQDFAFYNRVLDLAHQVNQGGLTDQQFFTQIWAFIQGYALLIVKGATKYDESLVTRTLDALIGGRQQ